MPNIVYTVLERVEMVRQHEQGLSYRRIAEHFAAAYPERPIPSKTTVQNIVKKFHKTGIIDPRLVKISQPKRQLTEEIKLNICLTIEEGLNKSLSRIAEELNVSKSSVHKVMRSQHYKPFKVQEHQQALPGSGRYRVVYSIRKNPKLPNVVYTVAESVELVRQHERGLNYKQIIDNFTVAYPGRPVPSKSTLQKILKTFRSTGNLDLAAIKTEES